MQGQADFCCKRSAPQGSVDEAKASTEAAPIPSATGEEAAPTYPSQEPSTSVEVEATAPAGSEEASPANTREVWRARIDIDAANRVGQVNKLLFGSYVIASGAGNGIVSLDHQFDPEALQMIRELRPSILRFGGQPIFEDGIGDLQGRPSARCGWEDWHTYEYGVDEHMALLPAIGAEGQAMFSIAYPYALDDSGNPASCVISSTSPSLSQMVRRATAWVAYMNGDPADTTLIGVDDQGFDWRTVGHWARQRANNGHPEPYGVEYWDIGCERCFGPGDITPEEYGQDYIAFRNAMKEVDPHIVVGASALLGPHGDSVWNTRLLSVFGPQVDALVLQAFYPNEIYDPGMRPAVMAAATQADHDLLRLRQLLTATVDRADEIGLILRSVGIGYDHRYEETIPIPWNMLLVGLYDADLMGVLVARSADYQLELGIQHWLHGAAPACAIHFDRQARTRYKRPSYYALQMWTNHFGDVLLRNEVTCDTFDVPVAYGNVGPLYDIPYLAAHTSVAEDRLYLLVINRHLTDDIVTVIHIDGFIPHATASVHTLNGPEVESTNEEGEHDTVGIVSSHISDASGDFTYVFPAHSVTAIEFQKMRSARR